jgi:hypothetical protein
MPSLWVVKGNLAVNACERLTLSPVILARFGVSRNPNDIDPNAKVMAYVGAEG